MNVNTNLIDIPQTVNICTQKNIVETANLMIPGIVMTTIPYIYCCESAHDAYPAGYEIWAFFHSDLAGRSSFRYIPAVFISDMIPSYPTGYEIVSFFKPDLAGWGMMWLFSIYSCCIYIRSAFSHTLWGMRNDHYSGEPYLHTPRGMRLCPFSSQT